MSKSKANINVGLPGDTRKKPFRKPVTLAEVIDWIKRQGFDPFVTEQLIKKAQNYPVRTFGQFKQNLAVYVDQIQKSRRMIRQPKPPLSDD